MASHRGSQPLARPPACSLRLLLLLPPLHEISVLLLLLLLVLNWLYTKPRGGTHARTTLTTTAEESNSVIVLERVPWIIRKLAAVRIIRDCRYCRRASPARDSARARRDKIVTVISTHSPRNHARDIYLYIYIYCHSHARSLTHSVDRTGHTHTHTTMLEAFNERTRARALASRWGLARRARGYARTGMCMLYIRTYVLPTCVTLYSYIRTTSTDGGRTRTRSPRAAPNLRLKDSTLNLQFGFKFPLVKSKGFIRD